MAHVLYTLGYCGLKPDDLTAYLRRLDAVLVDVRFSARSMQPCWRRQGLITIVGQARYIHLRQLGNRNYKGGPIELAAPDGAVMEMTALLEQQPAILLCGCADWHACHRTSAADWLAIRLGPALVTKIVHLPTAYCTFDTTRPQPVEQMEMALWATHETY